MCTSIKRSISTHVSCASATVLVVSSISVSNPELPKLSTRALSHIGLAEGTNIFAFIQYFFPACAGNRMLARPTMAYGGEENWVLKHRQLYNPAAACEDDLEKLIAAASGKPHVLRSVSNCPALPMVFRLPLTICRAMLCPF